MQFFIRECYIKRYTVLVQVALWLLLLSELIHAAVGPIIDDNKLTAALAAILVLLLSGLAAWVGTAFIENWVQGEKILPLEERNIGLRRYLVQGRGLFVLGLLLDGWDMLVYPYPLFFALGTTCLLGGYTMIAADLYLQREQPETWEGRRAVCVLGVINSFLTLLLWIHTL